MKQKELTYEEAMSRLEYLVEEIRNEEKDIDRLVVLVKEASTLVQFCRAKMNQVEEEINEILPNEDK